MSVYINGEKTAVENDLAWNEHPKFKGVFIKNILSGKDTGNSMSYHLVKIDPYCEIGEHIHDSKPELHEIIEGEGVAIIQGKEVPYHKAVSSIIDGNIIHSVKAGEKGLLLRATFVPALS